VTHTEKETEGEDGEKSHGKLTSRALICEDWFVWTEHDRFEPDFVDLFSPDSP